MPKAARPLTQLEVVRTRTDEDLKHIVKRFALVRTIQQHWAPAIIAAGVFNDNNSWTDSLAWLAEADPSVAQAEKALDTYFRLPGSNPLIADPVRDDATHESHVSDVAAARAFGWGDNGFLLGLAVGMLLGPHAFEGGVR